MSDSPSDLDNRIDRYTRGELSARQARNLAQKALDNAGVFEELTSVALVNAALESLRNLSDEKVARYVNGRLPASEERSLAEAALDREDVFDALAAHGAVEQSLQNDAFRAKISQSGTRVIRLSRTTRALAIGSIAAAALLAAFVLRGPKTATPPVATQTAIPAPPPSPRPALDASARTGQPILLAIQLDPLHPAARPVFRGIAPDTRPARLSGAILMLDQGIATIDLGSVDGITTGSELRVFRDGAPSQPIGRVTVTTVFREQSRGRIVAGSTVRERDLVRPDSSVHLSALLQQVEALRDRGELPVARDTAQRALAWAESKDLARGERRKVLELLASIEYQTGATVTALEHLQSAADSFSAPPRATAAEQAITQNGLGALYMMRGDYLKAEQTLNAAAKTATGESIKAQIRNNLGVLSELLGNSSQAAADYNEALKALDRAHFSSSPERHAIQTNLARIKQRN